MTIKYAVSGLFFALLLIVQVACAAPAETDPTPIAEPAATQPPTAVPSATAVPPTPPPTATAEASPTAEATETAVPTETPPPAEVQTDADILYATALEAAAEDVLLDVYYTPGTTEPKPVVVWAHGSSLDKSTGRSLGRVLAKNGFVLVSITWTDPVGEEPAELREMSEDADCVLRFITESAAQFGGDPQRVIWTGYSAGAWLGTIAAFNEGSSLRDKWEAYAAANGGPPQQVDCPSTAEPAPVVALVASAGAYPGNFWLGNGEDTWADELLAPIKEMVTVGNNPDMQVRMLHGTRDLATSTSFSSAETFAQALEEAGYDVQFFPLSGGHESFQTEIIEQVQALAE